VPDMIHPLKMLHGWNRDLKQYILEVWFRERNGLLASCVRVPLWCSWRVYLVGAKVRRVCRR
jgi:hypothetical protein